MLSRRTLLLADDSPTVQKVVSLTFADEGLEVLTASGGEEALARLGETVPDVLLADVHMPAPGGYELCARVKRDPRTARVPVLLLVGTFEPFDEAEARRVGADGVLTKPFQSIRDLVSKVGGLIGGNTEQNRAAASARAADTPARPEDDDAATAAHESPSLAAEDVQPHPAFAGFDAADDDSIESVPADDFVAAGRGRSEDVAAEFVAADAPFARAAAGEPFAQRADGVVEEVRAVEAAAVAEASSFGAAAAGRGPSGYTAARFNAPQAGAGQRPARAPQPPSDDSLLELGDLTSPESRTASDVDDLILDIGDDEDAADALASERVEASESAEVFGAVDVEVEASAEPPAEISPANLSSAWSDAPLVEVTPAPPATHAPASEGAAEVVEPEFEIEAEAAPGAESAAASVDVEAVETLDAPAVAASAATLAEVERPEVTRSEVADAGVDESAGAAQLSPETVDAIARRVVELMSDRAVREIAWEVVPDLAERLIRERLEKENTRTSYGESVNR